MSENKTSTDERRVKVVLRTKPTADFAHDLIKLGEDGKVRDPSTHALQLLS